MGAPPPATEDQYQAQATDKQSPIQQGWPVSELDVVGALLKFNGGKHVNRLVSLDGLAIDGCVPAGRIRNRGVEHLIVLSRGDGPVKVAVRVVTELPRVLL